MDFLGVGPLEIAFILIIALIIFGPNDIVRAGRTLGRFLRKVVTSDGWRAFQQASKGMRDLPTTLMREAGLEEEDLRKLTGVSDLEDATRDLENQVSTWITPPSIQPDNPAKKKALLPIEDSNFPETRPTSGGDTEASSGEPPAPTPGSPFSQTIDDNE